MKILILANNDVGLYKFRKELIQKLIEDGNDVYVSLPDGGYIPILKEMGCSVLNTSIDRRGMNPLKDLTLLIQYNQIVSKIKPDLILTYTIKPNIYGGLISRKHHIKYIENVTGMGTAIENGNLLSRLLLLLYKIALKDATQIFFQNEENQHFFENKNIVNKSRLIPGSGVNLQEHCYEEYPVNTDEIRLLFIGRIMKAKGIEELLYCAEKIGCKYKNVKFDLVGDFDEDIYQKAIEDFQSKGLINYLGIQDDVHSIIKTHHATILPSYHEGTSNVLLETAACGRPILATTVPGCKEIFDEGISGIGFRARDSEDTLRAIEKFLCLSYDERKTMGICGREKMEREYDRKIVIDAYVQEIYK